MKIETAKISSETKNSCFQVIIENVLGFSNYRILCLEVSLKGVNEFLRKTLRLIVLIGRDEVCRGIPKFGRNFRKRL